MEITKILSTYKTGPNKGLTTTSYKCSARGFSIIVSETLGSDLIGVSFSSSGICDVEKFEDGFQIASEIFRLQEKPYYPEMREIASAIFK